MSYFVVENFSLGLDRRKHILTLPPGALYTAKNVNINRGGEIEAAKAFVQKYELPAGTFGMVSASGQLYTFGSDADPGMPAGVSYQRLEHPSDAAMTELIWASVNKGKIFAIAAYTGGKIGVFYDGTIIADWYSGMVGGTMESNTDIASYFATIISTDPRYSATSAGAICTITGLPGVDFTVDTTAVNGGATDDQTASVGLSQSATPSTPETLSHGTLTVSGAAAGSLTALKVNGVEILGVPVVYSTSDNAFASAIASRINSHVSTPDYSATVASNVVTITAIAGTGAAPNGDAVAATETTGGIATTNMAGGVTAVTGSPQISTVAIGGTFEANDVFTIKLTDALGETDFGGTSGVSGLQATASLVHKSKTYAIAGPNLLGSSIGDPTEWDSGTGSFALDMSSETEGAERLTTLGVFQDNLAIFSRATIQILAVDADPSNNALVQVLQNIGCLAPRTVNAFGDSDLFFLSDSGLRSLKVRAITNNAAMSDIGSSVDPIVIAAIQAAGGAASKALSVIEPVDGRFLLQIGKVTYAFSYFPNAKVSAWTTWEHGLSITDFAVVDSALFARAGDFIYRLGGDRNDTYTNVPPEVVLPFLSGRQIDTLKHFTGFDVVCDGTFNVFARTNPQLPDDEEEIACVKGTTLGLGGDPFQGEDVEVISLRFYGRPNVYSRIATVIVNYMPLENVP